MKRQFSSIYFPAFTRDEQIHRENVFLPSAENQPIRNTQIAHCCVQCKDKIIKISKNKVVCNREAGEMTQLVKSLLCRLGDLSWHTCHLGVP